MRTTRENSGAFTSCHPFVNLCWFVFVLTFSMILMHPVCLFLSLACALACRLSLRGGKGSGTRIGYLVPGMAAAVLLNPIFNHEGATILWYFPNGNPLTLEAVQYGFAAAAMLSSMAVWFMCFNTVMTSDKIVYLFGRLHPVLSLVFSMTLRFIPRFIRQMKTVAEYRSVRRGEGNGLLKKARDSVAILSSVMGWALENSVQTADSMRSRGWGLRGRTAFSIYRFDRRDARTLGWIVLCGLYILFGALQGGLAWRYYPKAGGSGFSLFSLSLFAAYFALCALPLMIDGKEAVMWRTLNAGM